MHFFVYEKKILNWSVYKAIALPCLALHYITLLTWCTRSILTTRVTYLSNVSIIGNNIYGN